MQECTHVIIVIILGHFLNRDRGVLVLMNSWDYSCLSCFLNDKHFPSQIQSWVNPNKSKPITKNPNFQDIQECHLIKIWILLYNTFPRTNSNEEKASTKKTGLLYLIHILEIKLKPNPVWTSITVVDWRRRRRCDAPLIPNLFQIP